MKLDDNLNLVFPLKTDEDGQVLLTAFHTPISRDVFEANYKMLSETHAEIFGKGVAYAMGSGPRVASLVLKDMAEKDALDRGNVKEDGSADLTRAESFLKELKRLTVVLAPTENGYDMLPVDQAISRNLLDSEDWKEGEAALVFFTSACALSRRAGRRKTALATSAVIGGTITSCTCSAWTASLPISTAPKLSPRTESGTLVAGVSLPG